MVSDVSSVLAVARQIAASAAFLNIPMFLVDVRGRLEYYNDAAGALVGQRFDEIGPTTLAERGARWSPTNVEGAPIPLDHFPTMTALRKRRPVHAWLNIASLDGARQRLEVSAFPLTDADGELLGAVGLFWAAT